MAGLLNTAVNSLTNASVDSLVNGTIDTVLNNTFSSLFNTTYNKNGTTGAVVDTIYNLLQVSQGHTNSTQPFSLSLTLFRAILSVR